MPPDQARAIIAGLLKEGHDLLNQTSVSPMNLEQFEADCKRWSRKGREQLRRMWDQDSYAMSFDWAGGYGPNTTYDTPTVRFNRAHLSLRNQIHDLESQSDYIDIASTAPTRQATAPPPPERSSPYVVVRDSPGANVTIGSRVRDITTTVQAITGPSAEKVQRLTTAFAEAVANEGTVQDEERNEGLEQLKFVTDAAAKPGTHSPAILRPIVERLGFIARGSSALHSLYEQWAPAIGTLIQQQQQHG